MAIIFQKQKQRWEYYVKSISFITPAKEGGGQSTDKFFFNLQDVINFIYIPS